MKFLIVIFILNLFQNDINFNNKLNYKLREIKKVNKHLSNENFKRIKKELVFNLENEFLLYKKSIQMVKLTQTDLIMALDKLKREQANNSIAKIALNYNITKNELLNYLKIDLYKNKFLREVLFKNIKINDHELLNYYKSNEKEFILDNKYLICQIFTHSKFKLKIVLKKLKKDNFEELARKYSEAPEARNGGCLSWKSKKELPNFFAPAFKMKKSTLTNIVRSEYGYHIFLLKDKIKNKKIVFEEAKEQIRKKLLLEKQENKLKEFYKELRKKFKNEN